MSEALEYRRGDQSRASATQLRRVMMLVGGALAMYAATQGASALCQATGWPIRPVTVVITIASAVLVLTLYAELRARERRSAAEFVRLDEAGMDVRVGRKAMTFAYEEILSVHPEDLTPVRATIVRLTGRRTLRVPGELMPHAELESALEGMLTAGASSEQQDIVSSKPRRLPGLVCMVGGAIALVACTVLRRSNDEQLLVVSQMVAPATLLLVVGAKLLMDTKQH